MKIISRSRSDLKFSSVPTELDHLIESVADGLSTIAAMVMAIGEEAIDLVEEGTVPLKAVSSRLRAVSSKYDDVKSVIDTTKREIEKVKRVISSGRLMAFDTYEVSRCRVNNSSEFLEKEINLSVTLLYKGSPYTEAYYRETQVTIEYANLVRKFNECVSEYRSLHNVTDANFIGADTSLSFFKLRADVSNLPSVTQVPKDTDIDTGVKK